MRAKLLMIAFVVSFMFLSGVFLSESQGRSLCNKRDSLFRIERSKNENVVRYDACLLENGNISGLDPFDVYWILKNGEKEELNTVEKKHAYGIESKKQLAKNRFQIVITALKDREIIVEKMNADYKAFVQIKGKRSILEKVYVKSEENIIGFPKVNYIDLFGRSLQTNQPVKERIIPR